MGCYIAPDNASTTEDADLAIGRRPRGAKLLMVGDFNADLENLEVSVCVDYIVEALVTNGL